MPPYQSISRYTTHASNALLLRLALLADPDDLLTPALPLHKAPTLFWARLDDPAPKTSSDARAANTPAPTRRDRVGFLRRLPSLVRPLGAWQLCKQ